MANIGYIQVVRHCNHFCGFCSNPTSPYTHDYESMKVLVDDFADRDYFGVILTGGEPTLHPELPRITEYARERGLHVRMITNGHRLADERFAEEMASAGLQLVHVSVYSVKADVEEKLRGMPDTLDRAFRAIENAHRFGVDININCVINRLNASHLDEGIAYWIEHHPYIRHFVWNNLDPSMGRAEVNQRVYTPRLADFEVSLTRALRLLHESGRTFRVEKVPLCYMTEFGWASTETRKIVKMEERIVHFLDDKQTVRQTYWGHLYSDACTVCSLRPICGGLFDRGGGYDTDELYPVFLPLKDIVLGVITDQESDPSLAARSFEEWEAEFAAYNPATVERTAEDGPPREEGAPSVGQITEKGRKLFAAKRNSDGRRAERLGVQLAAEETDASE